MGRRVKRRGESVKTLVEAKGKIENDRKRKQRGKRQTE